MREKELNWPEPVSLANGSAQIQSVFEFNLS